MPNVIVNATNGIYENDWFLERLFINLAGYALVCIPGALVVYFSKKHKLYEGPKIWNRVINSCIKGKEPLKASLELASTNSDPPLKATRSQSQELVLLIFCFCGLQFSYLTWGILQEKITTRQYPDAHGNLHKFSDSQFLVFVNRVLALMLAVLYLVLGPRLLKQKQPRHCVPLYKYSYCSFSNIMSSWCQYEALKYVSFPTQVLAKTSKIIPVMLMGKLVSKKTYSTQEYLIAAAISVGMTIFFLSRVPSTTSSSDNATTITGVIILAGYMIFDSFTSNWQGALFSTYQMSSMQMMCGVNLFSCLLTSVSLWQQGSFHSSLAFSFLCPAFFWDCIALSICSATGQLFIFYTISQFGAVVFVTVMTVRQAVAIVLSCLLFGHQISPLGGLGIAVVFVAVFLQIYLKRRKK